MSGTRVYVAGDSTAATYPDSGQPFAGWGQALPLFLAPGVTVVNLAMPGASSKSFIDLGWLDHLLGLIRDGDHLLISFGHNDEKQADPARYTDPATTYRSYLGRYLAGARARGAIPVLVTPVERRHFTDTGVLLRSHGDYPAAMRGLARAEGVPLVDLSAASHTLWGRLGPEGSKACFGAVEDGDNTHFSAHGAAEIARLVATSLRDQDVLPSALFR